MMETNGDRSVEDLGTETYSESSITDLEESASGPTWIEHIRVRGRKIGAVGASALAFTGVAYLARHIPIAGAFESTPAAMAAVGNSNTDTTTTSETTTQTSGNKCDPANTAVDFGYVGTNVLPLAREILTDYKHTKKSQKKRLKNQHELYFRSYSHLTELDIARPARWEKTGRKGTYYITAQFSGRVIAKNMVAVELQEYRGQIAPGGPKDFSSYDYILEKTTQDGPEKPWGPHWNLNYDYLPPAKCGGADSKLPNGDQSYYKNSLSKAFFVGTLSQAQDVLKRMEHHRPLAPQRNLGA